MQELQEKVQADDRMFSVASKVMQGETGFLFVYCLEENVFYQYSNGYWKKVFDLEILSLISRTFTQKQANINRFNISTKKQIIEQLKTMVFKRLETFNSYDLINFNAGMFDVKAGNIIEHNPDYLSTIRMKYGYDKDAECPLWLKTLEGIFEGDKDKINVLQEYVGYCLTRDVTREKALLLLGDSRSGKSTILNTINYLIGEENVSNIALEFLSNPQYTAMLINKMINIDWDVSSGAEKFEANFKVITSGEPVNVNDKYVKTFTFRPHCKLIMAANKFPRITDHSSAFYKRLILIPCNRVFEAHEQDIKLKEKLRLELSGIFNWAVAGLNRLEERGYFEMNSKFMTDAIEELREESNPVDIFFKENITTDTSGKCEIEKVELYNRYTAWCKLNGNVAMANNKFGASVFAKYSKFTPKDTKSYTGSHKRVWKNLVYVESLPKGENVQWQD